MIQETHATILAHPRRGSDLRHPGDAALLRHPPDLRPLHHSHQRRPGLAPGHLFLRGRAPEPDLGAGPAGSGGAGGPLRLRKGGGPERPGLCRRALPHVRVHGPVEHDPQHGFPHRRGHERHQLLPGARRHRPRRAARETRPLPGHRQRGRLPGAGPGGGLRAGSHLLLRLGGRTRSAGRRGRTHRAAIRGTGRKDSGSGRGTGGPDPSAGPGGGPAPYRVPVADRGFLRLRLPDSVHRGSSSRYHCRQRTVSGVGRHRHFAYRPVQHHRLPGGRRPRQPLQQEEPVELHLLHARRGHGRLLPAPHDLRERGGVLVAHRGAVPEHDPPHQRHRGAGLRHPLHGHALRHRVPGPPDRELRRHLARRRAVRLYRFVRNHLVERRRPRRRGRDHSLPHRRTGHPQNGPGRAPEPPPRNRAFHAATNERTWRTWRY